MNNQNFDNNSFNTENNQEATQENAQFNPDYSYMQNSAPQKDEQTVQGEKKASSSKILGIIGLVVGLACCGPIGIVLDIISLVMASTSKTLLGYEHADAKAGKICSIVGIVISALTVIAYIVYFVLAILMIESTTPF